MPSFNNTEIAFAHLSDKALRKAYLVFKLISVSWLNKIGTWLLELGLALKLPVKGIIRHTIFDQFCGGESIEDCEKTIQLLAKYNIKTILDYSVEGKQSEEDFDSCFRQSFRSIERAKRDKNIPFSVIKLTAVIPFELLEKKSAGEAFTEAEALAFERGKERIRKISEQSHSAGIPLMVDAEESWIQGAIDDIILEMMQAYNKDRVIIFNTLQMYRHDRLAYLKQLLDIAKKEQFKLGIKMVRGAYMEKERARAKQLDYPSPIQADKESTDEDFNVGLKFCIDHIEHIALCCGTHNEESSLLLTELLQKHGLQADHPHIYFSQLLGMSDHISYNLSIERFNVAKYVPYGPIKEVMPYLIRRAEENSSISGQTGRELSLIISERKRRRSQKA
jgi:proline dehydrogenase